MRHVTCAVLVQIAVSQLLWGEEVITPLFCELQIVSEDAFIDFQREGEPLDVSLGPEGHATAVVVVRRDEADASYALIKSPGRPVEVLARSGDPLQDIGEDTQIRWIDHVEPGVGGRVAIEARFNNTDRLILAGSAGNLEVSAYNSQPYDTEKLYLQVGHAIRFNSAGQLAITGCASFMGQGCRSHVWIDQATPAAGLLLTGKSLAGLPAEQTIARVWDDDGFQFNAGGQLLMETLLSERPDLNDALVFIDGGSVDPVAVAGEQVPGLPAGEVYSGLFYSKVLADNGWMALQAEVMGGSIAEDESVSCLMVGRNGTLELVARDPMDAPERPSYQLGFLSSLHIAGDGTAVFRALSIDESFEDLATEIWQWRDGDLTLLGRGLDLIGGRGESDVPSIAKPYQSPDGRVYYTVRNDSGETPAHEIWMLDPASSESTLVAAPGFEMTLPNGKTGTVLSISMRDFDDRERLLFDNQGRFLADLLVLAETVTYDCAALIDPAALRDPDPVAITLHRATTLTNDSVLAGRDRPNAPLVPRPVVSQLLGQSPVAKGLVADGVTPLLLAFERTGEIDERYTRFLLEATVRRGGEVILDGAATTNIISKLHWLEVGDDFDEGAWMSLAHVANNDLTLLPEGSPGRRFAYLEGIPADALALEGGSTELEVEILLRPTNAPNEIVGRRTVLLRKPPITLVHGYNTNGAWGERFKQTLGYTRPYDPVNNAYNFVRTVTYGQNKPLTVPGNLSASLRQLIANAWWGLTGAEAIDEGFINHENTILPLASLVPMLHQALTNDLQTLTPNWAFTRHDVVAHSQGGLLTRMLCSERGISGSHPDFQSPDNYYRGRFHRVITIGSPHNGSRLLGYLLMLDRNDSWAKIVPKGVATAAVFSGLAQEKFDPFGSQIVDLNGSTRWRPDPHARFHLVRTTINEGAAPSLADTTPVAFFLGLNSDGGSMVLPRGSDGIVDFDSMGGLGEGQPVPPNVFTLAPRHIVSHSGPEALFSEVPSGPPAAGQTTSVEVAQHVIGALDQTNGAVFDSFTVPQLLNDTVRQRMQQFAEARRSNIDRTTAAIVAGATLMQLTRSYEAVEGTARTIYEFGLDVDNQLPGTPVHWLLETFGSPAENAPAVTLKRLDTDPNAVEVSVPDSFAGDVILKAFYNDTGGDQIPVRSFPVVTNEPEAVLQEIAIMPGGGDLPVGATFTPRLLAYYDDGQLLARGIDPEMLTISSDDPEVVDVSDPNLWRMAGLGTATVTTTYLDKTSVSDFTVHAPLEIPGTSLPDTDGDGVADLLEEAFGMDPNAPGDSSRLPRLLVESRDGTSALLLELSLPEGGSDQGDGRYAAGDFIYTVEMSEDLLTWQAAGSLVSFLPPVPDGETGSLVQARLGAEVGSYVRVAVRRANS